MAESIIEFLQKYSWLSLVAILVFGWFMPILMVITFICMIAPVVFSFKYGRAWCGNFCPRGSFNNSILKLISPNKPVPKLLKKPVIRLITFMTLMSLFTFSLLKSSGGLAGIGLAFVRMISITTLIEISMAVVLNPNAWCAVCPMGTVAGAITAIKGKTEAVVTISQKCTDCKACVQVCPMQINIPAYKDLGMVADCDCLKCRRCVRSCKNDALYWEMN